MLVRALKTTHGSYGTLPRGKVTEIPDDEAKELITAGYMIEELPVEKQEAAPKADNDSRPFVAERPTGFQTGADAPQSSLQADQAPKTLTFTRDVVPVSDISPSTTDTNSVPGPTPSTPVTTGGGKRKRGRPRSRG